MSDKVKILEYKAIRMVFADLSNLEEESILKVQKEFTTLAVGEKISFVISDITNTRTTTPVKKGSENAVASIKKACGYVYTAIIGVRGLQKVIANAITKDIFFATDINEAKEHIASKFT